MASRTDIIEAAAALFREQGYPNTSMADIAARAGPIASRRGARRATSLNHVPDHA